jgi:lipopolysaccharide/colanic/teichoic acid biosynthesis glycosyltransferase
MKDGFQESNMVALLDRSEIGIAASTALTNFLPSAEIAGFPGKAAANVTHAPRSTQPDKKASAYGRFGKRLLDLCLVVISLPVALPVILLSAIALWFESGLPFYRQKRLGEHGSVFHLLKLRTMVRDADGMLERVLADDPQMRAEWDATQKLKNDPRITHVGAFLRATSLDELPQLWNVLTGEMSLVGPRPMMPEQLPLYGDPQAYFAVKPGITGLWQVSARNENRFDYRCQVDAAYFQSISLWTDAAIMFRTVGVVARRTGY